MLIEFKAIRPGTILPKRNAGDAGLDVYANLNEVEDQISYPAEKYDAESESIEKLPIQCDPDKSVLIHPKETVKITTGLIADLGKVYYSSIIPTVPEPEGFIPKYEQSTHIPVMLGLQVRGKSGIAFKNSLIVTNSPGTIDCSYAGEIQILLTNVGVDSQRIKHGQKIAQLIPEFVPGTFAKFVDEIVNVFSRGDGGFGSTGI